MKILKGGDKKPRPCERCNRVVTPGRRHKGGKYQGWCNPYVSDEEKDALRLFVPASRILSVIAGEADWKRLKAVATATLRAAGINPDKIPDLERFARRAK